MIRKLTCKECAQIFNVDFDKAPTGDFVIACPKCNKKYRLTNPAVIPDTQKEEPVAIQTGPISQPDAESLKDFFRSLLDNKYFMGFFATVLFFSYSSQYVNPRSGVFIGLVIFIFYSMGVHGLLEKAEMKISSRLFIGYAVFFLATILLQLIGLHSNAQLILNSEITLNYSHLFSILIVVDYLNQVFSFFQAKHLLLFEKIKLQAIVLFNIALCLALSTAYGIWYDQF